jgi:hypothetical protein
MNIAMRIVLVLCLILSAHTACGQNPGRAVSGLAESPTTRALSKVTAGYPYDQIGLTVLPPRHFIYFTLQPVIFDVELSNPTSTMLTFDLECTISNVYSQQVFQQVYGAVAIAAGGKQTITVNAGVQPACWYSVVFDIIEGGSVEATHPSSYVVLPGITQYDAPGTSPFALGGGSLFHMSLAEHATLGERRLDMHRIVGAVQGRNDLWWGQIEPSPGVWDFTKVDSAVALFEKHDISLLGIFCYASAWAPNGYAPSNAEEVAEFVNYAKTLAARYKGRVKQWEVWNEPNIVPFWTPAANPPIYTEILKQTYTEVKKIDPSIKVVGMVTSLVDLVFIEECLKNGAGPYMDVISVHPYQDPVPPTDMSSEIGKIYSLRQLLTTYGVSVPIWITECGWQTISTSEETQAEYVVKFYVDLLSRNIVERIYWFNLDDWQPRESTDCCQYGLLYCDQTPKPSYLSYYVMTRMLHDLKQIEKLSNVGSSKVSGYKATFSNRKPVYIYWSNQGTRTVPIPAGVKMKTDIYGKSELVTGTTVQVTTSPLFLTNLGTRSLVLY